MKLSAALARANRLQKTRRFKIIATILVIAAAVVALSSWLVVVNAPGARDTAAGAPAQRQATPQASGAQQGDAGSAADIDQILAQPDEAIGPRVEARQLMEMIGSRDSTTGVALGLGIATGVLVLIIWLGVSLTYLALFSCVALIAAPLYFIESTQGLARLLIGLAALTASFTAVLEALRLSLSSSHPITAVARNVLNEAVRMKISIVFIVMLIIMLATLPGMLDSAQPLRYRVQTFL